MRARNARSERSDTPTALREVRETLGDVEPQLVLAFVDVSHDTSLVARSLVEAFPRALVVGCTTAGEIVDGARRTRSLVVSALETPSIRWAGTLVRGLRGTPPVEAAVGELCRALGCDLETFDPNGYFALALVDGLSIREESFGAALSDALAGIPIVGGSAGDGLAFARTRVFVGAEACSDAAAVVLAHAPHGFALLKHQHYVPTSTRLAVTAADPSTRRVDELDGRPAAEVFAETIGLPPGTPLGDETFLHPVTFSCGGEPYVRSVRTVERDGAMHFYCAVEEGMVLEVSEREDMREALSRAVDEHVTAHGRGDVFIGFNCILRALEMEQLGANALIAEEWQRLAERSIGFDTYGELWNGLHINQTLVGVTLREPAEVTR